MTACQQKLTGREKRTARHEHGLIRAKDHRQGQDDPVWPAEVTKDDLQKMQNTDDSRKVVRSLAEDQSQPFFRKNGLLYHKWDSPAA